MNNMNNLTVNEKENIFAVKVLNVVTFDDPSANGWELRYEAEDGTKENAAEYLRQRVWRDAEGKYFLDVKANYARCNQGDVFLGEGRLADHLVRAHLERSFYAEIRIPVTLGALNHWADANCMLFGEELARALEEFNWDSDAPKYERVWLYRQGAKTNQPDFIYEFLWKETGTNGNSYMLFSTDASYPYPCASTPVVECDNKFYEMYVYYITPETAGRWAEARGMGQITYQMVFGG